MKQVLGALVLAVGATLSMTGPASADFYPARELVKQSREFEKMIRSEFKGSSWDPLLAGSFMGYVTAATDALGEELNLDEEVDVTQVCSVVAKYFRDHPDTWNRPAGAVVRAALLEAFGRSDVERSKEE